MSRDKCCFLQRGLSSIVLFLICSSVAGATPLCTSSDCIYLPFVSGRSVSTTIAETLESGNRTGQYAVAGTVAASTTVTNVTIQAKAFDTTGQTIGTSTGSTLLPAVIPGQLNPFAITVSGAQVGSVAQNAINVLSDNPLNSQSYMSLTTSLVLGTTNYTGTIRNTSTFTLTQVRYLFYSLRLFFSDCQPVIVFIASDLKPNQTYTFSSKYCVDPFNFPPDYYNYRLIAQGVVIHK